VKTTQNRDTSNVEHNREQTKKLQQQTPQQTPQQQFKIPTHEKATPVKQKGYSLEEQIKKMKNNQGAFSQTVHRR
jgi:hypothetical protein